MQYNIAFLHGLKVLRKVAKVLDLHLQIQLLCKLYYITCTFKLIDPCCVFIFKILSLT